MLYAPASLVMTELTTPVALFVAVIVTPGTSALLGSPTVPPTVALLDWPKTGIDRKATDAITKAATRNRFMVPPRIFFCLDQPVYESAGLMWHIRSPDEHPVNGIVLPGVGYRLADVAVNDDYNFRQSP